MTVSMYENTTRKMKYKGSSSIGLLATTQLELGLVEALDAQIYSRDSL